MSEQSGDVNEHGPTKETGRDIILEFCRSHGAPSANWLRRLSVSGQRECIRQWIVRAVSPEIESLLPAVVEQLYEQRASEDPFFYDALSVEELEERVTTVRNHARKRLDEELRYGAICISKIDSPRPWVEYNRYRDLCDREWRRIVEENSARSKLSYALLTTLVIAAAALLFTNVRIAMWCAVVGGLVMAFFLLGRDRN